MTDESSDYELPIDEFTVPELRIGIALQRKEIDSLRNRLVDLEDEKNAYIDYVGDALGQDYDRETLWDAAQRVLSDRDRIRVERDELKARIAELEAQVGLLRTGSGARRSEDGPRIDLGRYAGTYGGYIKDEESSVQEKRACMVIQRMITALIVMRNGVSQNSRKH